MPVHNRDISKLFTLVADLLEINDENPFRVRAYRNAAQTIDNLSESLREMIEEEKDLSELPDIGDDLAGKIKTIVETGSLPLLEKLKKESSPELADMLHIEGLGPKRVASLRKELGIESLSELRKAAEEGMIQEIEGIGEKTQQKILEGLNKGDFEEQRTLLKEAEEIAIDFVRYLEEQEEVEKIEVAGSYRRRKETVGDLDILVTSSSGKQVSDHFVEYEDVDQVISHGDTKSSVTLKSGLQVDLRVVEEKSFGSALMYFTGSKEHNVALRRIAQKKGLKINEYGVFKGEKRKAGDTEKGIYDLLKMKYIPPELRENRGEIEAARKDELPGLIRLDDIRGDLQSHTTYSDGQLSLKEMAAAARERGLEYLAITDHSKHMGVTQGMDADELARQMDEIDELNEDFDDFQLLKSVEVDLLEDGSLVLPDDILSKADLVLIAAHTQLGLSEDKQMKRLLHAMDNPHVNILAHPTGRLIGQRDPADINMKELMEAALERGVYMEINANPRRLDLNDVHAKMARDLGLKLAINTDAHHSNNLDFMKYGIYQAKRGWLEKSDVLNTRSWKELKKLLKR